MMKRLNKFIEKAGIDKVLHFAVGGWAKKDSLDWSEYERLLAEP